MADGASLALVLESARENGDIVSSRKGIVEFHIRIEGRAAHAGVEPEKGRSATVEAAHKILALNALNGRWPDVTVNVGVVRGGTRPNVVAERCDLELDVRAVRNEDMAAVTAAINDICAMTRHSRRHHLRHAVDGLAADGEDASRSPPSPTRRSRSRRASASSSTMPRPVVRPMPTRRRGSACRRSTDWALSAALITRPASTWRSTRSFRVPR